MRRRRMGGRVGRTRIQQGCKTTLLGGRRSRLFRCTAHTTRATCTRLQVRHVNSRTVDDRPESTAKVPKMVLYVVRSSFYRSAEA